MLRTCLSSPWLNSFLDYLHHFDVIVDGIVFLMSLLDSLLLVYRSALDILVGLSIHYKY